jgi:hypothetical protein
MLLSNAGKEGRRQELSIRKTAPQLLDEDFDAALSRCFLDKPNDRFDIRAEMDLVRWWFRSQGRQTAQGRHTRQAEGRSTRDSLEKLPSCFAQVADS